MSETKVLTEKLSEYLQHQRIWYSYEIIPKVTALEDRLAKAQELRLFYAKRLSEPAISIAGWSLSNKQFCILQVILGEYSIDSFGLFHKTVTW
jgi:hypothetical protein